MNLAHATPFMRLSGVRALVVDADSSNAKLLVVLLRAEGADARSADSAESALSVIPWFRPDLVITEMVFDGMSGLALAREIRSTTPSVTIVIVSTFNGPRSVAEATAAGANGFFQKPIDTSEFVAGVELLLDRGGKE